MDSVKQVVSQIERDNRIRNEETMRMARFVLSVVIDPDGAAASEWRENFSLITKDAVKYLQSLATGAPWYESHRSQ